MFDEVIIMRKVFDIVGKILVWFLLTLSIFMMVFTVISVATLDRNDRTFLGLRGYIVTSDSMSKTDFSAGDFIVVKNVKPDTLKEGDIISFISRNGESFGETVTHKIRKITKDANGNPGFITYGTTTNTNDREVVTYEYVLGKYSFRIAKAGRFFNFLRSTTGYLLFILLPFGLIIGYQVFNLIRLSGKYKKEQLEQMQAERDELEAEKLETERLIKELKELKEKLADSENTQKTEI